MVGGSQASSTNKKAPVNWRFFVNQIRCWKLNDHHAVCFNLSAFRQLINTDTRTRGVRLIEVFRHYLINNRKISQIGQINIQFDDIRQTAVGSFAYRAQVFEYLMRFHSKITIHHRHGNGIKRNLTRQIYSVIDLYSLGISPDGCRSVGGVNNGFVRHDRPACIAPQSGALGTETVEYKRAKLAGLPLKFAPSLVQICVNGLTAD